jgi:hypothetical protein
MALRVKTHTGNRILKLAAAMGTALLAVYSHRAGYFSLCAVSAIVVLGASRTIRAGVLLLIFCGAIGLPLAFMNPTNSNLASLMSMFKESSHVDYAHEYLQFLSHQYGIPLLILAFGGAGVCSIKMPRLHMPIILAAALFFSAIAWGTWLFAHRYVFPLSLWILIYGASAVMTLGNWVSRRIVLAAGPVAVIVTLVGIVLSGQFAWHATAEYELGATAPTPPWEKAYQLIRDRHAARSPFVEGLNTVSPYPVLHDVYLGDVPGEKFYVPMNFSGHPSDVRLTPQLSRATVVDSLSMLDGIVGYLVLDDLAIRMIIDPEIRAFVHTTAPNAIIADTYSIYIWILE